MGDHRLSQQLTLLVKASELAEDAAGQLRGWESFHPLDKIQLQSIPVHGTQPPTTGVGTAPCPLHSPAASAEQISP